MLRRTLIATTVATGILASSSVLAKDDSAMIKAMSDSTWVTLSGEVKKVNASTFKLDYGDGEITVEVDDGDFDADAYKFIQGDQVTVSGKVDKDLLTSTSLEAASIYVKGLNTTFVSSAVDEESTDVYMTTAWIPDDLSEMSLIGNVSEINQDKNTVTLNVADMSVTVDTASMSFNPLDDEGYLQIEQGDRVKVNANIDPGFFDDFEIDADTIIKLNSRDV